MKVTAFVGGEVLRRASALVGSLTLQITMQAILNLPRARGVANFYVSVLVFTENFVVTIEFVQLDGTAVAWSGDDLNAWIAKYLTPNPLTVLTIQYPDGRKIGAPWSDARLASIGVRLGAVDGVELAAKAAAKIANVTAWADGDRKAAAMASGAAMINCAAVVAALKSGNPLAAWAAL